MNMSGAGRMYVLSPPIQQELHHSAPPCTCTIQSATVTQHTELIHYVMVLVRHATPCHGMVGDAIKPEFPGAHS